MYMAVQAGGFRGGNGIDISAVFDDASGLVNDAAVAYAGVKVGAIDYMDMEDGRASIHMVLNGNTKVPASARAEIRARSLLGEKYVALVADQYSEPWMTDGHIVQNTGIPYEIDQMVTSLGPLLQGLDGDAVSGLLKSVEDILASRDEQGRNLADKLTAVMDDVEVVAAELKDHLPGTLERLDGVSRRLPATMDKLDTALVDARSLLKELQSAAQPVPEMVAKLDRMIDELEPAARNLSSASEDAGELLERLDNLAAGFEGIDRYFLLELFREEGMLVRVRPKEVIRPGEEEKPPK